MKPTSGPAPETTDSDASNGDLQAEARSLRERIELLEQQLRDALDQAESELADREAMYQSLVEAFPHNLYRKDKAGRVTFANEHYLDQLGLSLEDALGKTDFDLFPPEFAEKYVADDERVMANHLLLDLVEEYQPPGGEKMYVQTIKVPVYDHEGNAVGTQGMFWDVTSKWKTQETQAKLAAIVEATDDAIIMADPAGKIISWNDAAERMYGYTAAQAIGQPVLLIVPMRQQFEVQAILEQSLAGARIHHHETQRQKNDGTVLDISLTVCPIHDAEGEVVCVAGVHRDITAQNRFEQLLAQFRTMAEVASDAMIAQSLEGKIRSWNPAAEKLYGYPAAEVLGKPIAMLCPPERRDELYSMIGSAARGEQQTNMRTQHIARDGHILNVVLTCAPIFTSDESEKVTGVALAVHQIDMVFPAADVRVD